MVFLGSGLGVDGLVVDGFLAAELGFLLVSFVGGGVIFFLSSDFSDLLGVSFLITDLSLAAGVLYLNP